MVNLRLKRIYGEWVDAGSPSQTGFDWTRSRANWQRDIRSHKLFVETLPSILDRRAVRRIAKLPKFEVTEKFLATMIWGYGDLGYGSYRVGEMFQSNDFQGKIQFSHELASEGDVIGAYHFLAENRIRQLGPAFGTKWIYFVSSPEFSAPIYDSVVSKWIERYASKEFQGISTSSESWNLKTYARYLEWARLGSAELGINAGELELIIFQDAFSWFPTRTKWANL